MFAVVQLYRRGEYYDTRYVSLGEDKEPCRQRSAKPSPTLSGEMQMVLKIREYDSAEKIAKRLDSEIAQTKSTLGKYLRRVDDIRALAERSKKVREVVMKLSSGQTDSGSASQLSVGGLSIVLDSDPVNELAATESAIQSHQEHLLVLQKAREALKWLDQFSDTDGIKYQVVENGGLPETIMFKITSSQVSSQPTVSVAVPVEVKAKA